MNVCFADSENKIFSVVVLCYNNQQYLPVCLDSILSQNYPSIEIIVADDGSAEFDVQKHIDYINTSNKGNIVNLCVYQNEKNLGTVLNVNTALKKATGRYIKIIAADDALFDENALKNAASALNESPCGIISANVAKCDSELNNPSKPFNRLGERLNFCPPEKIFKKLCIHNDIAAGGVFFDLRFFEKYGYFNESYRLLEDWPTWLAVTKEGCKIAYAPFSAIKYRSDGGIGTGTNPLYMADKTRVMNEIIKPSKGELGIIYYIGARLSFMFINSKLIRKTYSILFRKGK